MITDQRLTVATNWDLSGAWELQKVSPNTIDLLTARDIGEGEELYAQIHVSTAFASSTGATALFGVVFASDVALTANLSFVGGDGGAALGYTAAELTLGTIINLPVGRLKPRVTGGRRYMGIAVINANAVVQPTFTAGKVNAYFLIDPPAFTTTNGIANVQLHKSGFSVV